MNVKQMTMTNLINPKTFSLLIFCPFLFAQLTEIKDILLLARTNLYSYSSGMYFTHVAEGCRTFVILGGSWNLEWSGTATLWSMVPGFLPIIGGEKVEEGRSWLDPVRAHSWMHDAWVWHIHMYLYIHIRSMMLFFLLSLFHKLLQLATRITFLIPSIVSLSLERTYPTVFQVIIAFLYNCFIYILLYV